MPIKVANPDVMQRVVVVAHTYNEKLQPIDLTAMTKIELGLFFRFG